MSRFFVFTTLIVSLSFQVALAHPADGLTPAEPEEGYGTELYGTHADQSIGDVIFYTPYPSELSDAEKYIVAGTVDSPQGDGGMGPWWFNVVSIAIAYYNKNGELPQEINEDVLKSVAWQPAAMNMGAMQWYKSPVSEQFPKLDATEFSAGDMYIKVLSEAELDTLSQTDLYLDAIHNRGKSYGSVDSSDEEVALLTSPILYVRVYGEQEVIMSRLFWTFRNED